MNLFRKGFYRIGGFGFNVFVLGFINVVSIPLVIHFGGIKEWAAFAVGQSAGTLVSVFIAMGWVQIGPTLIAKAPDNEKAELFRDSLYLRWGSAIISVPIAIIISFNIIETQFRGLMILGLISSALVACGNSWFYVGTATPSKLFFQETLPRIVLVLFGCVAIVFVRSAYIYAGFMLFSIVSATFISSVMLTRNYKTASKVSFGNYFKTMRVQLDGLGIASFSTFYQTLPLLALSATGTEGVALFAILDRLRQQSMIIVVPVAQTLQSWVPNAEGKFLGARAALAAKYSVYISLISIPIFFFCTPLIIDFLSAGKLEAEWALIVPFSLAFGLNVITLISGSAALIPLGKTHSVLLSSVAGALTITLMLCVLLNSYREIGVAWSLATAQLMVAVVQFISLRQTLIHRNH